MKSIKFLTILMSSLLLSGMLYASNIGNSVYGVYTENYNGGHNGASASDADAIAFQLWGDQSMVGSTGTASPMEGNSYLVLTNGQWNTSISKWKYGGGGYAATNSGGYKDMSAYYGGSIKFYARSSNSNMTKFTVGVKVNGNEVYIPLSSFGFVANGSWQELTIPLTSSTNSKITTANLAKTNILLLFKMPEESYVLNDSIELDNIRWVKPTAGSFDVTLKNISNDAVATKITWDESVFRTSWKAANQYLDFNLDQDTAKNWYIKIYTNNNGIAGLVSADESPSLTMGWRINKEKLPSADGTLKIAQGGAATDYGLYDSGVAKPEPGYVTWFYFVDAADKGFSSKTDYMTVWSYKGFHASTGNYWGMSDMNNTGKIIAPKLYFCADFANALGTTYTSKIKVEFVNE